MGFVDELKEFCPSLIEASGGFIIAAFAGDCIELFEGDARLEIALGFRQGFQFLVRRHHVLIAVVLAEFALGVGIFSGKVTGAMEVEVGGQDTAGEGVHVLGKASRDMAVTEMLAHGRAVLALDQGVIVGLAGAGFGLFDAEFFQ